MYQFFRDVEDELSWIQDRKPVAESTDLGNSLTSVQNLMKKHQVCIINTFYLNELINQLAKSMQISLECQIIC